MKSLLSSVSGALLGAALLTGAGEASCRLDGGYVYTYYTCVAGSSPCQDGRFGSRGAQVLIISNVFWDDGRNDQYPSSVFFDELQIQAGLTVNGRESICYSSADEAQREQRAFIAQHMRWNQNHQVFRISMPNT